jgi:hypothetical protein
MSSMRRAASRQDLSDRSTAGGGRHLGAHHRPPARLPVVQRRVACPLTRRVQPVDRCGGCPHLQGTLDGPDPRVLCGSPARRVRPVRAWVRVRRLIFDTDWPDD